MTTMTTDVTPMTEDKISTNGAELIRYLHRGKRSVITLHRLRGKAFDNIGAIRTEEIPWMLPAFREYLLTDSFFSINGMEIELNKHSSFGFPKGQRGNDHAQYLNAAWSDVDCYQAGMNAIETKSKIEWLQSLGKIPPATLFHFSGNGLWAFWLLIDDENTIAPPAATHENKVFHARIQHVLARELDSLGADRKSSDIARIARIPGSLNTKWNRVVAFQYQADSTGRPFRYTLHQLATALNIGLDESFRITGTANLSPAKPSRVALPSSDYKCPNHRKGWDVTNEQRLQAFEILLACRGEGFREGCRNLGGFVYKNILRRTKTNFQEVIHRLQRYGAKCDPPLDLAEIRKIINQRKGFLITNQKIADWLDINPDESKQTGFPPSSKYNPEVAVTVRREREKKGRFAKMNLRREMIREVIAATGKTPSLREMSDILSDKGIDVGNKDTIRKDYLSLGIISPATVKKQARATARKSQKRLYPGT
jgi:hypothetical protein